MVYKVFENPTNGYRTKVPKAYNWWVAIFGPFWYFFNDMLVTGIAWLLVALAIGSFTFGIGGIIVWLIAAARAHESKCQHLLNRGWKFVGYEIDGKIEPIYEQKDS